MTREVVTVPPALTLFRAWDLMKKHRVRHLPVVQLGKLVGILSDRDILLRCSVGDDGEPRAGEGTAGQAMTPAPIVATPRTTVSDIAEKMLDHKIDAVPIVDDTHRLVGLVTSSDLLELLVEPRSAKVIPFDFRTVEAVG